MDLHSPLFVNVNANPSCTVSLIWKHNPAYYDDGGVLKVLAVFVSSTGFDLSESTILIAKSGWDGTKWEAVTSGRIPANARGQRFYVRPLSLLHRVRIRWHIAAVS